VADQKTRQQRRAAERDRGERLTSQPPKRGGLSPVALATGGIVGLLIVIAALVGAKLLQSSPTPAKRTGLAPAAVVKDVSSVPASTFDTIGAVSGIGGLSNIGGTPLTQGGKPVVLYIGAEYCPFCAAERWPLVTALSRFGTFTDLGATHSATNDVYPNTPTFSFHKAKYSSKYIALQSVELYGNRPVNGNYPPLEKPNAQQNALIRKYDPKGTIPFIYFGKYLQTDASYNPQILAGMTMPQVGQAVGDINTDQSVAILGSANQLTAAICAETGGQPASVCSTPGVTAAAKHLPKS
jgi:thiol-disulfide isomerase/thioredoxin